MFILQKFFGKFLILYEAVRVDFLWLALVGALTVAVALYYYLVIVKTMYFGDGQEHQSSAGAALNHDDSVRDEAVPVSLPAKIILLSLVVGILLIGFYQAPFMQFVEFATAFAI